MLVLVQDAAEAVASVDVKVDEPVGFGDRFGQRAQGCGAGEGAVRAVRVVERLVLAQGVQQVGLVPDQQPSAASPYAGGRVNLWVCAGDASVSPGGGC
jgi:hypothetical protein